MGLSLFSSFILSSIDEVFSVKVKLELKQGETQKGDDSGLSGGGIGGIVGGILGIIIIIVIFAYCCNQEKTYVVKEKSSCVIF